MQTVSITVLGLNLVGGVANVTCLQSADMSAANTPAQPTLVSPSAPYSLKWSDAPFISPPQSFCILDITGA